MSVFTVCSKFVEDCGVDGRLLRNTILHFVHDNTLRIAIDCDKHALEAYYTIAKKHDNIAIWLSLLADRGADAFDRIKVCEATSGPSLFFEIVQDLVPPKQLVCSSRQDYSHVDVEQNSVVLIDRAAAKDAIERACQGSQQTTNNYYSTTGDGSPIIQGNNNETGK